MVSQAQAAQQPTPQSVFISFHAEIIPQTSEALVSVIASQMQQGKRDIHLMMSTPGGQVASGIAVYNTLRALPITLTTYNVGTVNSIGNVIFLAGEKRLACDTSSFMFHGVGFDLTGTTARMEEKNLVERLESLRNDQGQIADINVYLCRTEQADRGRGAGVSGARALAAWPGLPHCGVVDNATKFAAGGKVRPGVWKCKACRKQFTVTVNTIFERSHIELRLWLMAFAIMCASKKGVSALQLQRQLGLGSYQSAWHMAHRVRHAMSRSH
jgi:ATP-dependent protease ClpP protease subunit/transposase-like protein